MIIQTLVLSLLDTLIMPHIAEKCYLRQEGIFTEQLILQCYETLLSLNSSSFSVGKFQFKEHLPKNFFELFFIILLLFFFLSRLYHSVLGSITIEGGGKPRFDPIISLLNSDLYHV